MADNMLRLRVPYYDLDMAFLNGVGTDRLILDNNPYLLRKHRPGVLATAPPGYTPESVSNRHHKNNLIVTANAYKKLRLYDTVATHRRPVLVRNTSIRDCHVSLSPLPHRADSIMSDVTNNILTSP